MEEPIFSRQEQGVVYLFSRYWQRIGAFKNKRISTIQLRFPDASMTDKTGAAEAIEFEYNLSKFYDHAPHDLRKPGDLKKLEEGYAALYIVYWDEDASVKELRKRIRRHFTGKVIFVRLSDYFSPLIKRGPDRLLAYWEFSRTKHFEEVYSFAVISDKTARLKRNGILAPLKVQKGVYRVAGFNKENAEFIECDHWNRIHFYTTSHLVTVPSRLFVRPTGSKRFIGCFEIKDAFTTINARKGRKCLDDYSRKYYFYPYSPDYEWSTCVVYSRFTELGGEQGDDLYRYLKRKGYWLGQASEVIDDDDVRGIKKIVG